MKVIIGTPIHQVKDYSIERWLKNVAALTSTTPADLLLVDNSPGPDYVRKVKKYLSKYKIKNFIIKHLKFPSSISTDLRIEASQETVRQYVLKCRYDAWFSWECDQIIPTDALDKLVELMEKGRYQMVVVNSWARWDPTITNTNMGCTLINRRCLEKVRFLPIRKGKISLNSLDSYDIHDPQVIKKRVLKAGGNYIEIYGVIEPVYHLAQ